MSTQSVSQHAARERPVQPDRAFDQLIWRNPAVCSECFARVKHIEEIEYGHWGHTIDHHERTDAATYGYAADELDDYGAIAVMRYRTTCNDCGSIRLLCQTDDYSKREMKARVPALIDRLREYGLTVHPDAVYLIIEKGKSRESLQGKDRELFATAVEFGIRKA